jgi:hypothetical protein
MTYAATTELLIVTQAFYKSFQLTLSLRGSLGGKYRLNFPPSEPRKDKADKLFFQQPARDSGIPLVYFQ